MARRRWVEPSKPFRPGHIDYKGRASDTRFVFERLKQGESIPFLSRRYKIPATTLYTWRQRLRQDPSYNPLEPAWGQHRRIFDDADETIIAETIRQDYLRNHFLFTDEDFKQIVWSFFVSKYKDAEKIPNFTCSAGFVADFKRRQRFSTRRQHFKRRPTIDEPKLEAWKQEIASLLRERDLDYVLNCDETSWKLFPSGLLTWADTGSQNVSTYIFSSDKECLTVMATVSANGRKFPLLFVADGKTELVEQSQLGDVGHHWRAHSENGWMTSEIMELYLMHLREECGDNHIDLILDLHASHRCEKTVSLAKELDIDLHFVPGGCTDLVQPCDTRVFGSLKATARALFRSRQASNVGGSRKKRDAVADMIRAWEKLEPATIEEGWACFYTEQ